MPNFLEQNWPPTFRDWIIARLRHCLHSPAETARRLFIPRTQGLMRNLPGKPFHVMPELFFQVHGINRIAFPEQQHALRAGRACLIPRGLPHEEKLLPVRGRICLLVIMFEDRRLRCLVTGNARHMAAWPYPERHTAFETPAAGQIAAALDNLAGLAQSSDYWSKAARRGMGLGIMAWLGAALKTHPVTEHYTPKTAHAVYLIARRLEDIELGTAMLAGRIGCTPDYLSALFHRDTGEQLIHYINRQRLEKACYLLHHTLMSVKEIAFACGFGDPDYFGRLFRRHMGATASRYRSDRCRPPGGAQRSQLTITPSR